MGNVVSRYTRSPSPVVLVLTLFTMLSGMRVPVSTRNVLWSASAPGFGSADGPEPEESPPAPPEPRPWPPSPRMPDTCIKQRLLPRVYPINRQTRRRASGYRDRPKMQRTSGRRFTFLSCGWLGVDKIDAAARRAVAKVRWKPPASFAAALHTSGAGPGGRLTRRSSCARRNRASFRVRGIGDRDSSSLRRVRTGRAGSGRRPFKAAGARVSRHLARGLAEQARRFDPALSATDIFQASRNVWTAAGLQVLLGQPLELTPAIFAYSMLYPYTDNLLDDPHASAEAKSAFNQRFRARLQGESPRARRTIASARYWRWWRRSKASTTGGSYPDVYRSLLAIQNAQESSVGLRREAGLPPDKCSTASSPREAHRCSPTDISRQGH